MDKALIVFVHGLGGHAEETWGSFPDFLRSDSRLQDDYRVESYGFPARMFSSPSIQLVADGLAAFLDNALPSHPSVALVCHSLGGLVARRYLIERAKRNEHIRVSRLFLFATPNTGADLARVGSRILWWRRQLRQLCRRGDLVQQVNEDWHVLRMSQRVPTRFLVGGLDRIVQEESARGFWGNDAVDVVIEADHRSIVKPRTVNDLSYQVVARYLCEDLPRVRLGLPDTARSWANPQVTSELLGEIFGLLEGLGEAQVRTAAVLLRLQLKIGPYTIPCWQSRESGNRFHDDLRALRNARVVKAPQGGRFEQGRQALVQPWAARLLQQVRDGTATIVTSQGKPWKAILHDVDRTTSESELRAELDSAACK